VGWLTRDVADQAFIWPTISTASSEVPATPGRPPFPSSLPITVGRPSLQGLRIGVPRDWLDPESELSRMHDPEIRDAFEDARARLVSLGIEWVPVGLPPIGEIIRAANQIICSEAAQQVGRWLHTGGPLGAGLRKRLAQSSADDLEAYHRALADAGRWRRELDRLFDQAGIVLIATPGREQFPETLASLMQSGSGPRTVCNRLYSLTGHPALTMPMGLGAAGLPMAIQFAARAFDEASLIGIAAHLEEEGLGLPAQVTRPWC
jgi:aspartyl-tRNA(Asn)/glutamyl-tRNA(Gln) amidotransferase subunit A